MTTQTQSLAFELLDDLISQGFIFQVHKREEGWYSVSFLKDSQYGWGFGRSLQDAMIEAAMKAVADD